ncbi:glycosyltransferase family 4 protein [Infirmifilum sp. NZ]|uniref:glycosyltransferase family 4 protein n=1 Tax=Infirmifilum sp. NZ TaxID=2926850 RepID=UPI0027A6C50B|nr:glycosyltransferase family 4 protein [Infirmifilum sp. NZ]UNQ73152.1 glycosyltransferase family 4 protein [Infirmifilum sp. NZ]
MSRRFNIVYSLEPRNIRDVSVAFLTLDYFNDNVIEGHRILSKRIIDAVKRNTSLSTYIFSLETARNLLPQEKIHFKRLVPSVWEWMTSTYKIFEKLKTVDVDIVHILSYSSVFPALLNKLTPSRSKDFRIIAHIYYGPDAFKLLQYKFTELLLLMKSFEAVIATSKLLKEFLVKRTKLTDKMTFYIPPIVPKKFFDFDYNSLRSSTGKYKKLFGLKEDDFVISYIGHITPQRGVFELLKAFNKALGSNSRLRLIISPTNIVYQDLSLDYLSILEMLIKKYGLNHRVLIVEKQDPIQLFAMSDVLFLGFDKTFFFTFPPLIACEAVASGMPVILKQSPLVYELFSTEKSLPIYKDLDELTDIILDLADNKNRLSDISLRVKAEAVRKFMPEQLVSRLLKVYMSLTGDY